MAERIDIFKDARRAYERIKDFPEMLFEKDANRDKRSHSFTFDGMKGGGGGFSDMTFRASCHWGEYGRSGCSDRTSPELGRFLAMAINLNIQKIYEDAVEYARCEMEVARLNAAEEARQILEVTTNEVN